MLAQFHVTYASNGATVENFNKTGATVTYTLPGGTVAKASLHANSSSTWLQPWYQGHVWPTWNSTWVGDYYPSVNASDQYGNVGTYKYSGYAYPIMPAALNTAISLSDAKTGALVTGLYNGQSAIITANIQYLQVTDPVPGFNGPLDAATRGGVVTVLVGWGPYNTTSSTFGTKTTPGGLIATVPMTYSTITKVWTGPLNIGTLPTLSGGATAYTIVVSSHDKAAPANSGFATLNVPPATLQPSSSTSTTTAVSTVTATAVSTATSVTTATATATATSVSTATATAVSTATSVSVVTSTRTAVNTNVQTNTVTPFWAYALLVVILIELGIPIGYVLSKSESREKAAPQE